MELRVLLRVTPTSTQETGRLEYSVNAYEHPQPHTCFIQSVGDSLVGGKDSIMGYGIVRLYCSSIVRAPALTSPRLEERASLFPEVGALLVSCHS